ncbi:MipA/OmpV family protein [Aureimonas jatrophae]|uniref:MipA/OmpV family protein n=1 Tax=Aureimonas jatrophae TaxID=1166073 RepID=UPI00180DF185|nr:MipA/OmpV family protein [Aureimonas jatrophae]MBB3951023.1 outer membrane scaffolding protein for murein synthesis (MipA/OmpV family) [Aureimonas jatrophae]
MTSASEAVAADASVDEMRSGEVPSVSSQPDPSRFGRIVERLGEWEVVVGGGALIEPEYEGSDEFEVTPVPFVSATYGDWLKIDPTGAAATVYRTDAIRLDGLLGYETGRSEDDSDRLRGLGDVDFGVNVGALAALEVGPAELFVSAQKTIGGSDGFVAEAGAEVEYAVSQSLFLGLKGSATFADEKHMQAYFGIDAVQSVRSGYAAYEPDAGIKRVDLAATATFAFNENWFARGEAGVGVLIGDAADSPIVQDEIQPSGLLLVGYRF